MRTLIPVRDSIVCKKLRGGTVSKNVSGITINSSEVDEYEVLYLPEITSDETYPFSVGDIVMSNSTGDKIEINPGEVVYLFKLENIMCKICN